MEFKRLRQKAGLPNLHVHGLRHTAATLLLSELPVVEVSLILGHSGPAVAMKIDAHPLKSRRREAAAIMARLLP